MEKRTLKKIRNWDKILDAYSKNKLYEIWGPRIVQIEITNSCNLRCKMCSRGVWNTKPHGITIERMVRLFSELKDMGTQTILLSGGEPFLRKDISDMLYSLRSLRLKSSIFTNGTLLTSKNLKSVIDTETNVCFSIDGANALTHDFIRGKIGTFDKAINNLSRLVSESKKFKKRDRINIGINCVIQKGNCKEIVSLLKLAEKIGVDYLRFGLVHGFPERAPGKDDIKLIISQLASIKQNEHKTTTFVSSLINNILVEEYNITDIINGVPSFSLYLNNLIRCLKCHQYSLIDAFGNVFPCTASYFDNFPLEKYQKARDMYCLGNILSKSFSEIWNGQKYNKFRNLVDPVNLAKHSDMKMICGQCEHFYQFKKFEELLSIFKKAKKNPSLLKNLPYSANIFYEIEKKSNVLNLKV